jgi:hypothetical protein
VQGGGIGNTANPDPTTVVVIQANNVHEGVHTETEEQVAHPEEEENDNFDDEITTPGIPPALDNKSNIDEEQDGVLEDINPPQGEESNIPASINDGGGIRRSTTSVLAQLVEKERV